MRRVLVLLAVVALLTTCAPVAVAAGTGEISGMATRPDGTPLAGVVVRAFTPWPKFLSAEAITDAEGHYSVTGLAAEDYAVCFYADDVVDDDDATGFVDICWKDFDITDGGQPDHAPLVTVDAGSTTSGVDQALPAAGGATGVVTDAAGAPISGALVHTLDGPLSTAFEPVATTTDAEGRYTLRRVPPSATYSVCVHAADALGGFSTTGYFDQCYGDPRGHGRTPSTTVRRFSAVGGSVTDLDPIELEAAAQITGTVTSHDGRPIPGVRVSARGLYEGGTLLAEDDTDGSGHFLLRDGSDTRIPNVSYTLSFETESPGGPDYVSSIYGGVTAPYGRPWAGSPTPITPTPGTPTTIAYELDDASSLGGVVTDANGDPLGNVSVDVYHDGTYVTDAWTNDSGAYRVPQLPQGQYAVCFRPEWVFQGSSEAGYLDHCIGAARSHVRPSVVTLGYDQDRTDVGEALPSASGVSGRITSADGRGVPFAQVFVFDHEGLRSTLNAQADGTYKIQRLEPGDYDVCFDLPWAPYLPCYDGVPDRTTATPVTTTAGKITTGINAHEPGGPTDPIPSEPPPTTPPATTLTATALPAITGTAQVGRAIVATPGSWSSPGRYAYQWLAGGVAIPGAISATYTPDVRVLGKPLSVRVTTTTPTNETAHATSALTAAVRAGTITALKRPAISGRKKVGGKLTATPGTWTPDGLRLTFQWLRDGKAIKGAHARTYRLRRAAHGHRFSVRVTATRAGCSPSSRTSTRTGTIA